MSKQLPSAPTASAVGPCPTLIKIVGRPGTGSLPSTIAPPDHPLFHLINSDIVRGDFPLPRLYERRLFCEISPPPSTTSPHCRPPSRLCKEHSLQFCLTSVNTNLFIQSSVHNYFL